MESRKRGPSGGGEHRSSNAWRFVRRRGTSFLPLPPGLDKVEPEAVMRGPVQCMQCDKPERDCKCDKYCSICKGMSNIRLCEDGLYYCPECREACDVHLANNYD